MRTATTLVALALLGVAAPAWGDAIGPPPTNCPAGAQGTECHGPDRCAPRPCGEGSTCGPGWSCVERQLCVRQINCGGGWGAKRMVDHVAGVCSGGATCENSECRTLNVCVADTPPTPPPLAEVPVPGVPSPGGGEGSAGSRFGCDCTIARGRAGGAATLLGVLVVSLGLAARRRLLR